MVSQANSLRNAEEKRLVFIDALRVAAIAFVIIHHAAQAYGPTGGFWPVLLPGWALTLYFCLVSKADASGFLARLTARQSSFLVIIYGLLSAT